MIIGDALRLWTRDDERQRAARAAADAFGAGWQNGPVHQHFTAFMAGLRDRNASAVTHAFLTLFADDAWVDVLVDSLAAKMRADPYFMPPFQTLRSEIHSGLLVYEDDQVMVAAGVSQAAELAAKKSAGRGGSINFSGQVNVLKFVRAGDATLSFWKAPATTDDFSAGNAGTCRQTGSRRIEDGDLLVVDGRSQSYVVDHASENILLLQAVIKTDQAVLGVEYDAGTGAYLGCSAADDMDSRIQMISTLVRKLGHREAFSSVAAFLDHPRFFVRWHVMRELIGIDARAALPHLRRMAAQDPHPDVRRAANATLDRLAGPADARKAA